MATASMRSTVRFTALLSLVAVLTACDGVSLFDPSASPPVVRTERASVPSGGAMPLLLINESQEYWDYGACSHQVDRLEAGTWVMVDNSLAKPCIAVAYSLGAGETANRSVTLPTVEGTYRIRFRFLHFPNNRSEAVWATSNQFIVGATTLPD